MHSTKKQATKNPKLSDLKQQKCILMVLDVKKNLNLRCWQDCAPSKGSGGSFWWRWLLVAACSPHGTPVSAPVFTRLLSSLSSPLLSLRRTFAVKFRAHLGNPAWSHFKILNYICRLFPNKVTFPSTKDLDVDIYFEGHSLNGFSGSHVRMWQLDHKEGWVLSVCFQTVMLEMTLESPLESEEIKPVNPEGNQP